MGTRLTAKLPKRIEADDIRARLGVLDNASAILHTKDRKQTDRSKHIRLIHWFARKATEDGQIKPIHMPGKILSADAMTKPLGKIDFIRHRATLLGIQFSP